MNPEGGKIVIVEVALSIKDFFQAHRHLLDWLGPLWVASGVAFIAGGVLRLVLVGDFMGLLQGIGLPALLSLALAGLLWQRFYQTDSALRSIQFTFTDSGIDLKTEKSNTHLDWSLVTKFVETKEGFHVYFGPNFSILPKQFFAQPEDMENLRALARQALGAKVKLFNAKQRLSIPQWISLALVSFILVSSVVAIAFFPTRLPQNIARDFFNRGYKLYESKDFPQARKEFNAAIVIDHNFASAYQFRGYLSYLDKDYEAAESDYTTSIDLDKNTKANIYYDRALIRVELGKLKKAQADLNTALILYAQEQDKKNYNAVLEDLKQLDKLMRRDKS